MILRCRARGFSPRFLALWSSRRWWDHVPVARWMRWAAEVLAVSNLILAAGLALLAFAHSQATVWLAWLILDLGMGIGLYDTAFAALGRVCGSQARSGITGITVVAGFPSSVGWPVPAVGSCA